MKLNCDLGESFGNWTMGADETVMPHIDQANIACGFHAGDPVVLARTLALAKQHNVDVGAHPSYPDLAGFGRRSMQLSAAELTQTLHYQLAAISGMAAIQGLSVGYVKPHGALYNDMMKSSEIRQTIFAAIAAFPQSLNLMVQATPHWQEHQQEASKFGVTLWFEAFADRRYNDDGLLLSRHHEKALLSEDEIVEQVSQMVSNQQVITLSGQQLAVPINSLCVHGDNPTAIALIQQIRQIVHCHDD